MTQAGKGDKRRPEGRSGNYSTGHDLIRWKSDAMRHDETPNETHETRNGSKSDKKKAKNAHMGMGPSGA